MAMLIDAPKPFWRIPPNANTRVAFDTYTTTKTDTIRSIVQSAVQFMFMLALMGMAGSGSI